MMKSGQENNTSDQPHKLTTLLEGFAPISIKEMDGVALMNRRDTKFILTRENLEALLTDIQTHYRVLDINGDRIHEYKTIYSDTRNFRFYNDHHRGKRGRIKIRTRSYVGSGLHFLEIKQKNKTGDTNKTRMKTESLESHLSQQHMDFIEEVIGERPELIPVLYSSFSRITLVGINSPERITIDTDIDFNDKGPIAKGSEKLVIVEVKQSKQNRSSAMVQALRAHKIRPLSISKYCIGLSSKHPHLKRNSFKRKYLKINKTLG